MGRLVGIVIADQPLVFLQPKPGLFRQWQKLFRILSSDYKDDLVGEQNVLRGVAGEFAMRASLQARMAASSAA